MLGTANNGDTPIRDPLRRLGNPRRAAAVLISCGVGGVVLGFLLSVILQLRVVLSASAAGVIPIAIGIGFLMDYRIEARELARFGLEVNADTQVKR